MNYLNYLVGCSRTAADDANAIIRDANTIKRVVVANAIIRDAIIRDAIKATAIIGDAIKTIKATAIIRDAIKSVVVADVKYNYPISNQIHVSQ